MAAEGDTFAAAELERLPEAPSLDPRWTWLWRGWMTLHRSRGFVPMGMGGALSAEISWFAVEEYADRLRCTSDERATLHQVIEALDRRFIRHERERRKAAEEAAKNR